MDKAVAVRGADGLLVELLGLEHAAFDPGDLRAYECGAVLEILRTIRRPCFKLSKMSGQSLAMLLVLRGARKREAAFCGR